MEAMPAVLRYDAIATNAGRFLVPNSPARNAASIWRSVSRCAGSTRSCHRIDCGFGIAALIAAIASIFLLTSILVSEEAGGVEEPRAGFGHVADRRFVEVGPACVEELMENRVH